MTSSDEDPKKPQDTPTSDQPSPAQGSSSSSHERTCVDPSLGKRRSTSQGGKKHKRKQRRMPSPHTRGGRSDRRRQASQEPDEGMWFDDDEILDEELGGGLGLGLESITGLLAGRSNRFKTMLTALQQSGHDRTTRLLALQELSEALSMATEHTLLGQFPTTAMVAELVYTLGGPMPDRPAGVQEMHEDDELAAVLAATAGDDGGELEMYACRCLAHLLEALPASSHTIVRQGAVPLMIAKLQEITYIDLAEQVMQTLEKLSATDAQVIVRHGGMHAMLQYLDFFSLYVQRTAMTTVANCCEHLTPALASRAADVAPMIHGVLGYTDQRLVEAATHAVCSMVQAFAERADLLDTLLLETDMIPPAIALLWRVTGKESGPALKSGTYADLLHALATAARTSTAVAEALFANRAVDLAYFLLTGAEAEAAAPSATCILENLAQRASAQVLGALALATDLLPALPHDGLFDNRAYSEKAYASLERRAAREGCVLGELDAALDDAPARRQSAAAMRERHALDERVQKQQAWPDFYATTVRLLLPTLVEVYAASVMPQVRMHVFSGLLRLLYYADADLPMTYGQNVPLASFVTGVAAAHEAEPLVEHALQTMELLLTKLPKLYATLLVREGALHETEALASDGAPEVKWRAKIVHARLLARVAAVDEKNEAEVVLASLRTIAEAIRAADEEAALEAALAKLATWLTSADSVTSFEMLHSGLVDAVYAVATDVAHALPVALRRKHVADALAYTPPGHTSSAGYRFVRRLHQSLSRLEDLQVVGPVLDAPQTLAQQVRIRLQADDDFDEVPRAFRSMMVSIHGVATVQTLHDFLRPKLETAFSRRAPGLAEILSALSGESENELMEQLLDDDPDQRTDGADVPDDVEASETALSPDAAQAAKRPEAAKSQKSTAPATSTEDAPDADRSYATAAKTSKPTWHLAFTLESEPMPLDATLYGCVHRLERERGIGTCSASTVYTIRFRKVEGAPTAATAPVAASPPAPTYAVTLPECIPADAPYSRILQLLGAVRGLADEGALTHGAFTLNDTVFINNKLTAKLGQQLQERLIVASACLPDWAHTLPAALSFLFPFETRHTYFQSTALGHARVLAQYKRDDPGVFDEVLTMLSSLPRQKVRIARDTLLPSAVKVMELYSAGNYLLEVEYFDEVGSGLGPTQEFYALVSQALTRADLGMWRATDTITRDEQVYVDTANALYPADHLDEKARKLFGTLGQFVAKSLLDGRIIDVPLHPVFMRAVQGRSLPRELSTLAQVDAALARSLASLQTMPPAELDALEMEYTVPGSGVRLSEHTHVTASNVGQYVDDVLAALLDTSAAVEAFRTGFGPVLSLSALDVFAPEELTALFGRREEDWSEDALRRALVPDHGMSADSPAFVHLVALLSGYTLDERRAFLQWLTGAPRLPMGGFASLHPPLTVVRRENDAPLQPDDYLPSVMTCVNYLKLPDYSSRDVMRARLDTAVKEGLTSFHLS